jgi:rhodanese-related sulfurtransferase
LNTALALAARRHPYVTSIEAEENAVHTITRAELADAIGAGTVTVVDALPAAPFATRHLPGAINLPIEQIASVADVLPDMGAAIVTYSTDAACERGPGLAEALAAAGYTNVRNYSEGIADWAAAGLPVDSGTGSGT